MILLCSQAGRCGGCQGSVFYDSLPDLLFIAMSEGGDKTTGSEFGNQFNIDEPGGKVIRNGKIII